MTSCWIHNWGKWKVVGTIAETVKLRGVAEPVVNQDAGLLQERQCAKCGFVERNVQMN